MHAKYLGVDSYLLGGILTFLIDVKGTVGSAQQRLDQLWSTIRDEYRRQGATSRCGLLTLKMFRASSGPFSHLKGKASEIKGLIPILLAICKRGSLSMEVKHEKLMILALEQTLLVDRILMQSRLAPVLPDDQKNLLVVAVRSLNRLIQALGAHFHVQAQGLFNYTVKNHVLDHIAAESSSCNPTWAWTFSEEDFMLRVRHPVGSSAHGSTAQHLQNVVMGKWLRGFELELWPGLARLH